jgi:hypothetical protein
LGLAEKTVDSISMLSTQSVSLNALENLFLSDMEMYVFIDDGLLWYSSPCAGTLKTWETPLHWVFKMAESWVLPAPLLSHST